MLMENRSLHLFPVPKVQSVVGRMDFVLEKCKGKKVLHLGCVDEGLTAERINTKNLLHFKLIDVATEVWGVDISKEGLKLLEANGADNLVWGDIEQIDKIHEIKGHDFDVILLTEVLEHLNNPGLFLQGVKNLFHFNTIMIITVPNGLRLTGLLRQMQGYELVHPDHNYWFSYKTIRTLMEKNGYDINEMLTYSLFNTRISVDNIVKKYRSLTHNKKKTNELSFHSVKNVKKAKGKQKVLISACAFLKRGFELLLRKYISGRNPFLAADGIIAIVQPKLHGSQIQ